MVKWREPQGGGCSGEQVPELLPAWEVQDGCWVSMKELALFDLLLGGTCTSYRAVWGGAERGRTRPTESVSEH